MKSIRLGQVDYLNCLPVYYAFEQGRLDPPVELVKGPPTRLNERFLRGELEVTPLSSIEYARHPDRCLIVPGLSISSNGRVGSIFLISKVPATELDGRKVCLPDTSATSVVLLKVLFEHYYHVEATFETTAPALDLMLSQGDAGLLIGDEAIAAGLEVRRNRPELTVLDLGEAWKSLTGEPMVFALWVIRRDFAAEHPEETAALTDALHRAREIGRAEQAAVLEAARRRTGLPRNVIEEYFELIRHDFGPVYQQGLLTFFDYAYKTGLIEERVRLAVWGDRLD
ncbi:MAG: menaquinone biosynthesis protein [Candidatus Desulforudis sp.]|nr:menaquinone biosynthesis protein [Desulforudis sp.]